jgi:hypothetical protein
MHPPLYSSHLRELNVYFPQPHIGEPRPDSDSDESNSKDEEDDKSWRELAAQMSSLSSASGLRRLTLTVPDRCYDIDSFSLEPLECLKELEPLILRNGGDLTLEQLVPIRRLPSLRTLSLDGWFEQQVEALLEDRPDCPPYSKDSTMPNTSMCTEQHCSTACRCCSVWSHDLSPRMHCISLRMDCSIFALSPSTWILGVWIGLWFMTGHWSATASPLVAS